MHRTGSYRKRVTGTILIFFLLFFSSLFTSFGEDTVPVEVSAQYGQTEARTVLAMVNNFRTGVYIDGGQSSVWAYAKDGTIDTSSYTGLGELQYDYELEKVAMERAMELVLQFDHERPDTVPESNVNSWKILYPAGYSAQGENIAAGYGNKTNTAEKAFDGWCETSYPYSEQGHRRNMLGRGYNRIGVAHVIVHYSGYLNEGTRPYKYETDVHYWVQEFGYRNDSFGLSATTANDSEATASINVLRDNIDHAGIETESDSLDMSVGESKTYDGARSVVRLSSTWPVKFSLTWNDGVDSIGTYYVTAGGGYSLSIDDPTIASVSGNSITAKKAGITNLTIHSGLDSSVTKSIELTVEPVSLAGANVTFSGSYEYSGKPQNPLPEVTLDGKTLEKDIDYSIVYENNTDAGEATATITGKGNYKDSASGTFVIGQKPVSGADVVIGSLGTEFTYNGKVQRPSVSSVTVDSITLNAGKDYDVSAPDSIDKGAYELTISGKGNYTGTITKGYSIKAKTLTKAMADVDDSGLVYNGEKQLPAISMADADTQLTEGNDFTVEGGGVNAGKYDLTFKGINNYEGSFSVEYEIGKAERPPVVPENNLSVAYNVTIISNSLLNDFPGWTFDSEDIGSELKEETPVLFHVSYNGSDAGNYAITFADIKITRRACEHPHLNSFAENASTCTEDGNIAYWQCSECKRFFDSKDADREIAENSWIVPAHHTLDYYNEKTYCGADGMAAHYECSECHKLFVKEGDEYIEKTEAELKIPATGAHTAGPAIEENRVEETKDHLGHYEKVVYCSVCHAEISRETIEIRTLHDAKEAALADLDVKEGKLNEYDEEDRAELRKAINDARTAIENAESVDAVNTASGAASKAISSKKTAAQKAEEAAAKAKAAEAARQGIYDAGLPKVKFRKLAAKKTSVSVNWTKLTNKQLKKSKATHYEIWVSESPDYPAGITTKEKIVKKSKSNWTCKGLKKNKKYYVRIRAIKYVGSVKHVGVWKQKPIKTKKK